jgi:hypothetical protein
MAPNNPPDRPWPPAFFDNGDDGLWADALRFVRFPVLDFESAENPRGNAADVLCVEPDCGNAAGTVCTYALCPGKRRSASPFHEPLCSPEAQHDHA